MKLSKWIRIGGVVIISVALFSGCAYDGLHKKQPEIDRIGIYTNPWTKKNPAPENALAISPGTIPASDQYPFEKKGVPFVYFEATDWFAKGGKSSDLSYSGYIETEQHELGDEGMFMNTKYDTLKNLEEYFPGRAMEHFNVHSPLLSALILEK